MHFSRLLAWMLPAIAGLLLFSVRCAAAPLAYDVPYFDPIIPVDGNPTDWGSHGLLIDQLTPLDGGAMPDASQCDARVRLGWDPSGLMVLVEVTDPQITESKDDKALGQGDAVELFLAPSRESTSSIQVVVAPPLDPTKTDFRTQILDHRVGDLAKIPIDDPIIDSVLTPRGYLIEALLRWDDFNINAAAGQSVAFQVCVDHMQNGQVSTLGWYPESGADYNFSMMNILRLSKDAGDPVEADGSASYVMFRRVVADFEAPAKLAGETLSISDGDKMLGSGKLDAKGGRATATITIPVPGLGKSYGPLTAKLGASEFERIDLPSFPKVCADQFARERVVASRYIFTNDTFPSVSFEQPGLVEDLIGPYTISTRYFDNSYKQVERATTPGRYGAVVDITTRSGTQYHRYLTLFRAGEPIALRDMSPALLTQFATSAGIDPAVADANSGGIAGQVRSDFQRASSQSEQMASLLGVLYCDQDKSRVRIGSEADRWLFGLQKSLNDPQQYQYLLALPPGYDADAGKRWPLVLFLHGAGERGSDINIIKVHGPPMLVAEGRTFPFILVSPQCPENTSWNTAKLSSLLDEIEAKYRVDTDRIYVTGLSMGGFGTYNLAMDEPNRFAAIAPMSSGADPDFASLLKSVPIWVFHGDMDTTVPIAGDQAMVDALKAEGADVTFTIVKGGEHAIWDPIYSGDDIYTWLLSHSLKH